MCGEGLKGVQISVPVDRPVTAPDGGSSLVAFRSVQLQNTTVYVNVVYCITGNAYIFAGSLSCSRLKSCRAQCAGDAIKTLNWRRSMSVECWRLLPS